jgi:tRNA-2-methylthio-N6-dimethylallyladenosine synthase
MDLDPRVTEFLTDDQVLPRFHVWTLGCQMNHSDSEEMAGALLAAGCAEADGLESADLVVINSCAIREAAEHKVIGRMGAIGRLKAANPAMRVVLTGCSVRADDPVDLRRRYPAVDLFLRPDQEPELTVRLGLGTATSAAALPDPTTLQRVGRSVAATADRLPGTRAAAVAEGTILRRGGSHAWLPVIYGCDKTCTYCIVPFSRGPERSRPFDDIVEEARQLAATGYREVTLLGQNVNSYGRDLRPRVSFAELLAQVDAIEGIDRIRYTSPHPKDMREDVARAHAELPAVCEHIHLPLQSGSSRILKAMRRTYDRERYLRRVEMLREHVPDVALTTDIIVAFPGETEDDFRETLEVAEEVGYDGAFTFIYSPRRDTEAADLPGRIPHEVAVKRMERLVEVVQRRARERAQRFVGRTLDVLVEGPSRTDPSRLRGRTRHNKVVNFTGVARAGEIVPVRISSATSQTLAGDASLVASAVAA